MLEVRFSWLVGWVWYGGWDVHTLVLVEEGGAGCHEGSEDGDGELHFGL